MPDLTAISASIGVYPEAIEEAIHIKGKDLLDGFEMTEAFSLKNSSRNYSAVSTLKMSSDIEENYSALRWQKVTEPSVISD